MKNNKFRLKCRILFRYSAAVFLAALVGYGIFSFLADEILPMFRTKAPDTGTRLAAAALIALLLCMIIFCIAVNRMMNSLDSIGNALDKVISQTEEPVVLDRDLEPLADKMEQLKTMLKESGQEAALSEQKKNELVAYLAHDLRTPLTSVIAYLSMLSEHPEMDEIERAKYTHITLEKALRLEELLNEFFDITTFNIQGFVLEKEEMNLSLFLEQIADESYGMLSEKGMECAVDVEEDLVIHGDPDKLARVFDNLIRNAAAYGRENTQILIQARKSGDRTAIIFTNEGPQIPQKKLETIFERFYRADDSRSSQTGGAGLGLAIARQIVRLHGGTITAVSDIRNTRFIVTLPNETQKASGHRHGLGQNSR